jgi:hypothetical protein
VPWCVSCNKFLTPNSVRADATCPTCGRTVERGLIPGMTRSADEPVTGTPWHLKLLLLAFVLYMSWRTVQIVDWIF